MCAPKCSFPTTCHEVTLYVAKETHVLQSLLSSFLGENTAHNIEYSHLFDYF